jgi:UDP-N-acetylmuramoyl-tripeptide--D-alanyl-D-alanine ligase
MLLSEAAGYMDGEFLADEEAWVASVGSDSRNIAQQELFFALKGENFDGHSYVEQALKQGACAVVISDTACKARPAILVKDTLLALGVLAKSWRETFTLPVIAITGSNGKTTVKEMLTSILKAACNNKPDEVLATVGNLNNHIGMPMTLLKIRKEDAFAVIEMGMNHLGEIDYLTHIAQPSVALINNAGTAHIGELGSRDNIAKAKGEIFAGLSDDGIAVINADDNYAEYWKSLNSNKKIITFGLSKVADVSATFTEKDGVNQVNLTTPSGQVTFNLSVLGKHNISNALAASAAAVALGISNADIASGLSSMQAVYGRLQTKTGLNSAILIDDTYNANPDSMKAAIDVLAAHQNSIFVMGDMAELGENAPQMHADIGLYAKQKGIEQFFAFGDLSVKASQAFGKDAKHFDSIESLVSALKTKMKQGVTVLVKGSRFMQMERVVKELIVKEISEQKHEREKTQCC